MKSVTQPAPTPITSEQLREARAALGWSAETLAVRSKTTVHIVNVFERSGRVALKRGQSRGFDALAAIRTTLEAAGVDFIEQNGGSLGVRLRGQAGPE